MTGNGAVVVVGGTRAIGLELVRHFLDRGDEVWLTGQSEDSVAAGIEIVDGMVVVSPSASKRHNRLARILANIRGDLVDRPEIALRDVVARDRHAPAELAAERAQSGTRIAHFDGGGDHSHNLWVMNADGTERRLVLDEEVSGAGHMNALTWSPDGGWLAFATDTRIYLVRPDGTGLRPLVHQDFGVEPAVQWSPDGSRIAYCALDISDPDSAWPYPSAIFVVDTGTGDGTRLTEFADSNAITVMRMEGGRQRSFKFHYKDVARGKALAQNIQLQPGDTVVLDADQGEPVAVVGQHLDDGRVGEGQLDYDRVPVRRGPGLDRRVRPAAQYHRRAISAHRLFHGVPDQPPPRRGERHLAPDRLLPLSRSACR